MTFVTGGFTAVFPVFPCVGRIPMARCAVGLGVWTAGSVADNAFRRTGIGRCSTDSVAGGTKGVEIAGVGDYHVVVEILDIVDDEVVAVVAGRLVVETDVDVVTVHTNGLLR